MIRKKVTRQTVGVIKMASGYLQRKDIHNIQHGQRMSLEQWDTVLM